MVKNIALGLLAAVFSVVVACGHQTKESSDPEVPFESVAASSSIGCGSYCCIPPATPMMAPHPIAACLAACNAFPGMNPNTCNSMCSIIGLNGIGCAGFLTACMYSCTGSNVLFSVCASACLECDAAACTCVMNN